MKILTVLRCGKYFISGTASAVWRNKNPTLRQIANASGWIRDHPEIFISSNDVEILLALVAPSIADRANKLLITLDKKIQNLGASYSIDPKNLHEWIGISYSTNSDELHYLFNTYLSDEVGYIVATKTYGTILAGGRITPRGYAYLDSLKHTSALSQIGFCAMWFDIEMLPTWKDAISPAIYAAGYDPKRIDVHQHNNKIDDEIIAMIRRSKFVVADFTGQRGGVYFEAGFALGLGLPVIWTCEKSNLEEVHFDNRQYNFVQWEKDKLSEFKRSLQNRIEATLGHGTFS